MSTPTVMSPPIPADVELAKLKSDLEGANKANSVLSQMLQESQRALLQTQFELRMALARLPADRPA